MDGFLLTHASERVDPPAQEQVDAFLPRYQPRQVLDPDDPVSIGAMVGPEAFTEVRFLAEMRMRQALDLIPAVAADFGQRFGRPSGGFRGVVPPEQHSGLVRPYLTADAELIVVALGSVLGTIKDTVDELRADGIRAGVLGITSFRPFPAAAVRAALDGDRRLRRLVVIERALAPGSGGIVTADLRAALAAADGGTPLAGNTIISTVIAGLGGRPVTSKSLRPALIAAQHGALAPFSYLDLREDLAEAELARMRTARRSGPSAENMLRDLSLMAPGAPEWDWE
jgi:pyruvate ferredoxin oxidoreductase alpha subunit